MKSAVVNDERLKCRECGSTEATVAPRKQENDTITGSVCTGCGMYTELSINDFDLYEYELTQETS